MEFGHRLGLFECWNGVLEVLEVGFVVGCRIGFGFGRELAGISVGAITRPRRNFCMQTTFITEGLRR